MPSDGDAEWLRSLKPVPFAIQGHTQQPSRKYVELSEGDVVRLHSIADGLDRISKTKEMPNSAADALDSEVEIEEMGPTGEQLRLHAIKFKAPCGWD